MRTTAAKYRILHFWFGIQKLYFRFVAVKPWLKYFLFIALLLIGVLTNILTDQEKKLSGYDFWIRISYAYLTSFLFYFIVVHIPKEDKKQAINIIINNRTLHIMQSFKDYYMYIINLAGLGGKTHPISFEEFGNIGKNINPFTSLTIRIGVHQLNFKNHYDCYSYLKKIVDADYDELMRYYDLLPSKYIYPLNRIYEAFQHPPFNGILGNSDLAVQLKQFHIAYTFSIEAWNAGRDFKKKYDPEFKNDFRLNYIRKQLKQKS